MVLGLSQETAPIIELSADIFVGKTILPAVAATPGWRVLGEYLIPKSTPAQLYAFLATSHASLTARVRLWSVTDAAALGTPISAASLTPQYVAGGEVSLVGGQRYQIHAECTGSVGDDRFAVVESAGVTG